jgi:hypothetical protein
MTTSTVATRPGQGSIAAVPKSRNDELTVIRQVYARDLSDDEFGVLVADANHRGLDVVSREIIGIKFKGQLVPFVTLAGARKLAERSGKLAGIEGPFFCGPDGAWVEVWLEAKPPAAAKFIVHRTDTDYPVVGIATWKERANTSSPTWMSMPSVMLGKVAEMDAFRRARMIPDDILTTAEMSDDDQRAAKTGAMRHLHGVGRERGLGHDELRSVVKAVKPGTRSMSDPDVTSRDLGAAADLVDALGDEAIYDIVEDETRLAEPADGAVTPQDDEHPALIAEADFIDACNAWGLAEVQRQRLAQFLVPDLQTQGVAWTDLPPDRIAELTDRVTDANEDDIFMWSRDWIGEIAAATSIEALKTDIGEGMKAVGITRASHPTIYAAYVQRGTALKDQAA